MLAGRLQKDLRGEFNFSRFSEENSIFFFIKNKADLLKKHLSRDHKATYTELIAPKQVQSLDSFVVRKDQVLDHLVTIAVDGRPFSFFESPGMKKLIALAQRGAGEADRNIDSSKVRQGVVDKANEIRKWLTSYLEGQHLSISTDFASLHGIEFMGKQELRIVEVDSQ